MYKYILLIVFILGACSYDDSTPKEGDVSDDSYIPASDDVVDTHGEITNLEKLNKFVEDVHKGFENEIRIVRYTVDGDPVLQDLKYDTEEITYTNDTTYDQHGNQSASTMNCKSIEKRETDEWEEYFLTECDNTHEDQSILIIEMQN